MSHTDRVSSPLRRNCRVRTTPGVVQAINKVTSEIALRSEVAASEQNGGQSGEGPWRWFDGEDERRLAQARVVVVVGFASAPPPPPPRRFLFVLFGWLLFVL